jgi:hypothetical protein
VGDDAVKVERPMDLFGLEIDNDAYGLSTRVVANVDQEHRSLAALRYN